MAPDLRSTPPLCPPSSCPLSCKDCPAWQRSVWKGLSEDRLAELQKVKRCVEKTRGDAFNRKGEPADGAYCIAHGNAKVSWQLGPKIPSSRRESIVKIVTPGDMTGYRCLFSEACFRATAIALEQVQACFIPKEAIFQLLESDPVFTRELLRRMGEEIAAAEKRLDVFCQKNVRERLADALLFLYRNCGVKENDRHILQIHLTRGELSSWIGAAKETVVRSLSEMKDEGIIEQDGAYLTVLNIPELVKIAAGNNF